MKVVICGGGTGGHIYPALAAVAELQAAGTAAEDILWIGTRGEIEETLVPRAGLRLETITGGAIVGVPWRVRIVNGVQLTWSVGTAMRLLTGFRPDVLFMTGGYVNGPVALAARLLRVPAAIYLPDIEPGAAIRTLSRLARRVACTAAASKAYFPAGKTVVTGYPVRSELRRAAAMPHDEALAQFDLTSERKTLFVFGGSRGARSINRALMAALPALLDEIQVIHISGRLDWPEVETNAGQLSAKRRRFYRPYAYLHEEMGPAFRAADLVLARSGASMMGECPAFGLPAVLVPYPYAWRYQKVNADYLAGQGAGLRLDDERLGDELLPTVLELIQNERRLADMAVKARALDIPDSAARLASVLRDLGERKRS